MSKHLLLGCIGLVFAVLASDGCHTGRVLTGGAGSSGSGSGGSNTAGTGNTTGVAGQGSGEAGTTGSGNTAGSGTAGGSGNTAGTGTAGDVGTGVAGTTGAAGSGTVTADMIDNLDDNDARIMMANGRQGPWHSFNDSNGGNQQPPIGTGFLPASGGVNNSPYAVHTTGSGYQFGGVGFDLNNSTTTPESAQSMAYNASAYNGITFWAKGSGTLRVEFAQRSFVPTDRGGSCTGSCWNVYGANTPTLTSSWQQITISFSSLQREQGGTSPAFTPGELMGVSFKAGSSFDFWIDEVAFTRSGGGPGTAGTSGSAGRGGAGGMGGAAGAAGRGGTTGVAGTTGAAGTTGQGGTGNVVHPPPITNGMNGWTTRYWDCCKPSCGWRNNVGGGTPARSCNQQNMSIGDNDQSACSGGGSYTCWNYAPFALDDTLAYGFVAMNGVPCGRCYQVQFTGSSHGGDGSSTGPLNGKTMIVQVTNRGDLANDGHMDLLIPGGGVGSADADGSVCKMQFGNVDLGAQYGGFRTSCNGDKNCVRNRCMTVFNGKPDMLAGCLWYVDWFNAADNPNMIYKEISCPQEIRNRSGFGS
jgi:hypothetical protein